MQDSPVFAKIPAYTFRHGLTISFFSIMFVN
jgi:hypothetical protein